MSRRIGERLVAAGLLTKAQVDEALQSQLLSGGTIGTSLLDLGLIDEDEFAKALSDMLRVGQVDRERMKDIPADVIARLESNLAEKHLAIPIEFEDKTLHIATAHPRMVGSLSRITGYKIVIWTAPEIRIYEALERYYDIAMRPRHARIIKDLEERRKNPVLKLRETVPASDSSASVPELGLEPTEIDLPDEYGYGRDWRAVAAELDAELGEKEPTVAETDERRSPTPLPRTQTEFRRIEDVYERFCDANFKEELFEATLGYMSQKLHTCILFGVRSQLAHVWDWRSPELTGDHVKKLRIPVGSQSIFGLLLGRSFYRGPLEDDDAYRRFYNMLKIDPPAEVLLLPVYVNDRLVAAIYGDNGEESIAEDTGNYRLLVEKLSAAFNLLILKMKIRG